ncbi:MAG: hypothetical protein IJ533_02860 [Prevotella sp.]|nr:hypothetical protein [Prevotella sp.]
MKKQLLLSLVAAFMMALGISAQNNSYSMVIEMTDGTKVTIGPNDIKNMTFTDGQLTVSGESIDGIKKDIAELKEKINHQKGCECSVEISDIMSVINVLQMQIKSLMDEIENLKKNGGGENNSGGDDNSGGNNDNPEESSYKGEAVDLGLSVKWASCNVGATKPEEYGGFYAWGETQEKETYSFDTYIYAETETSYQNIGNHISGTQYDVAHTKWGGSWRMPTIGEMQELVDKCSWTATVVNGVNGTQVTGSNGNSIFLPAGGRKYGSNGRHRDEGSVGCYWSGTLYEDVYAMDLLIFDSTTDLNDSHNRANGMLVRPVSD